MKSKIKNIWFLDICSQNYDDFNVIYGKNIGYKKFKDWSELLEFIRINSCLCDVLIFEGVQLESPLIDKIRWGIESGYILNSDIKILIPNFATNLF